MPDQNYLSLNGAKIIATANQTRMALSVMHLFKEGFVPTPSTTKAEFDLNECDYDGYAPLTITAWGAPVLAGQAWATFAPTQTFRWVFDTTGEGNQVGGHYIVTAGGELIDYSIYDPTVPMQIAGNAVVKTPIEVTPAG